MQTDTDTIAAIATAIGPAGIAVIRLSGPASLTIAERLVRRRGPKLSARKGGSFVRGLLHAEDGEEIDEVIVLIYRAPHSYTREDVVEIQCHGGRQSAMRILRAVVEAGARVAEAGEFTKRAFLNGRLDLAQAEAVADLVSAATERAAQTAVEQLEGGLSAVCDGCYDRMLSVAADLEATLDFEEGELPETTTSEICSQLGKERTLLEELLGTWDEGHLLRDGALVVLCGRPNVGKSTLLNALLETDRAIVTPHPGTTRDTIEENVVLDGVLVRLVDTAGLRDTACHIEKEGVLRTEALVERADLILYVIDGSVPLDPEEQGFLFSRQWSRALVILNKQDLGTVVTPEDIPGFEALPCSMQTRAGLPGIRRAIPSILGVGPEAGHHATISERHRKCIQSALTELNASMELAGVGHDMVLAASSLRAAIEHVGSITGRSYSDDLLDRIFSRFCVGK